MMTFSYTVDRNSGRPSIITVGSVLGEMLGIDMAIYKLCELPKIKKAFLDPKMTVIGFLTKAMLDDLSTPRDMVPFSCQILDCRDIPRSNPETGIWGEHKWIHPGAYGRNPWTNQPVYRNILKNQPYVTVGFLYNPPLKTVDEWMMAFLQNAIPLGRLAKFSTRAHQHSTYIVGMRKACGFLGDVYHGPERPNHGLDDETSTDSDDHEIPMLPDLDMTDEEERPDNSEEENDPDRTREIIQEANEAIAETDESLHEEQEASETTRDYEEEGTSEATRDYDTVEMEMELLFQD